MIGMILGRSAGDLRDKDRVCSVVDRVGRRGDRVDGLIKPARCGLAGRLVKLDPDSRTPEEEADACRAAMEAGERFAAAERRAEGERRRAEANLWRSPNFHFGVRVELPTLSFPPTEESCSRTVADVLTEVKP